MEELVSFVGWFNTLEVIPTIKSVRDFFETIRTDELDKIKHKISDEDFNKLDDMTRRMIGRILHNPTVKLRSLAESGINYQDTANYSFILKELFDIDNKVKSDNNDNQKD
jgi:glutamyl-tRNA reductase